MIISCTVFTSIYLGRICPSAYMINIKNNVQISVQFGIGCLC